MKNKQVYLITRGDDCGSNHSANKGILEAYRNGMLKNTSVMAPCAAIKEAAKMFAAEKGLCCGLHATLNAEWDSVGWGPVLPPERVPSLVDGDGHFFRTTQKLHDNKPKLSEIMDELQAQLEFVRSLGFEIRYADTHMGFCWVEERLEAVFDSWCKSEGIINANKYHFDLPLPKAQGDPVECLLERLGAAPSGLYCLVVHPAYDNEEMRSLGHPGYPGDVVAVEREWDRRLLTDPRILEYCRQNGIIPVRFDEVVLLNLLNSLESQKFSSIN